MTMLPSAKERLVLPSTIAKMGVQPRIWHNGIHESAVGPMLGLIALVSLAVECEPED